LIEFIVEEEWEERIRGWIRCSFGGERRGQGARINEIGSKWHSLRLVRLEGEGGIITKLSSSYVCCFGTILHLVEQLWCSWFNF